MNTEPEYPDELEGLLREQLRGFAPEAPERVWSRIEARLPERRRRPVFWWWVLGLGILSGLGVWAYLDSQLPTPVGLKKEEPIAEDVNGSTLPAGTAVMKNGSFEKVPLLPSAPFAHTGSCPINTPVNRGHASLQIFPGTGYSPENEPVAIHPLADSATGAYPAFLPFGILASLDPTPISAPKPYLPSFNFPPKNKQRGRLTIGLETSPVWIFYKNNSTAPHHGGSAPAFSEHLESPSSGWQTGVSLAYAFAPQWRLETGLWRREETLHTTHLATLRLLDGVCLNPYDYGAKHYEFQYALRSGGTTADVTVRISQVDSTVTMPLDEPFSLDMRTTRQTRSWTLPLSLSRSFGHGRWQGFVRGGLALDYTAETSVQVEHFSEMCVDLCFSTGHLPSVTLQPQQRFSVQYLFGAGLEYRLLPRFSLRLEPAFFGKKGRAALAANAGVFYHF